MKNKELEVLFVKYYNDAFLYVLSLSRNKEVSEDVVSQAFFKALTYPTKVLNFKAWLFTVCRNLYYEQCRRNNNFSEVELAYDSADSNVVQAIDKLIKNEEYKILYKSLERLNLQQREVILLFYFENLSIKEIAIVTNETEANVKVILHRGRKKLKEILEVNYEV